MQLTGSDIVELIQKYDLQNVECYFSLPNDIYQNQHRKRLYYQPTPEELYTIYSRHNEGETIAKLAKEYNAAPSYLSSRKAKNIVRQETLRRKVTSEQRV